MGPYCSKCNHCKLGGTEKSEIPLELDINVSKLLSYNSPFMIRINENMNQVIKLKRFIKQYIRRNKNKSYNLSNENSPKKKLKTSTQKKIDNKVPIEMEIEYSNGIKYKGQAINGIREGYGVQTWPDNSVYEGYWKNDKAEGKGTLWHHNCDKFEG